MSFRDIQPKDEFLQEDPSRADFVRRALICLLLGGGFLGLEKFLHGAAALGARLLIAQFSEFLGWAFLVSSTLFLFSLRGRSENQRNSPWPELGNSIPWPKGKLRNEKSLKSSDTQSDRRSQTIDKLYAELRPLMSRAAADPSLRAKVQAKLAHLRRLQTEEADEMVKCFDAGLLLKPGEGWQALERARELLTHYEDPASTDSPTSRKD